MVNKSKNIIIFFFLIFLFYFICLFFTKTKKLNKSTLDIAHRGYALKNQESTIQAFKYAIKQNTDGLELDIRQTHDRVIIVSHNKKIKIFNKDIKELDFYHIQKSTKIPTLEKIIQVAKKYNKTVWIEIKESSLYKGIIDNLLYIIKKENYENNIIIQSFNLNDLTYIHEKNKNIKLLKLNIFVFSYHSIPSYIDYIGLPILTGILDCNLIDKVHKKGYKIIFWRESSLSENKYFINFLKKKGADGFMLDKPLRFFH